MASRDAFQAQPCCDSSISLALPMGDKTSMTFYHAMEIYSQILFVKS